ncbi:MAG: DUF362 domain-containing protein, partial [Lachnospiraceae bacterium]|nr:DUF362 domain-containing protein [Lachnospiraceae bacterium]
MRKIMALVLAAILVLTVCGCQQAAPEQKEESREETVASEQEPSSEPSASSGSDNIAYDSLFPQHEPYGTGVGAMPGRVVWAHDPDCVEWDGTGWWWEVEHFDEAVIQRMVDESIAALGGKDTAAESWQALFTAHNISHSRGENGYLAGEKIAIKVNINGSGLNSDDASGETEMSYTNPVLMKALLVSLVEEAGI